MTDGWLAEVETGWPVVPAKSIFVERREPSTSDDVHLTPSQTLGVLPQAEYMARSGTQVVQNLSGQDSMKHVEPDDFVIHLRSFQGGIEHSSYRGKVSTAYTVLRPTEGVEPRFFRWLLKSDGYVQELRTTTNQLRDGQSIKYRDFAKLSLPRPELPEQRAIADYLDREIAQIDTLIEEQRRLVELTRERRQAVLDDGFSSGEIWPTRVGRLLRARPSYGVLKPDYVPPGSDGIPLVRVSDILRLHELPDLPHIASAQSAEFARTRLDGGEIVLGVVGKLGQAAVVPPELAPANTSRPVAVLRCENEEDAPLLVLWFGTHEFHRQASDATAGDSIQPTLGMKDLSAFSISWPGDPLQRLDALRDELASIDQLLDATATFLALSNERRAALVTAAVTGQIDVGVPA